MEDIIFYIVMLALDLILLTIYIIYVIVDEKKKIKFFNYQIHYDTEYKMYINMVKKIKKIIRKKKIELLYLTILLKIRRIFIWNK